MIIKNDILGTLRTHIFYTRARETTNDVIHAHSKNAYVEDFLNPVPGVPSKKPAPAPEPVAQVGSWKSVEPNLDGYDYATAPCPICDQLAPGGACRQYQKPASTVMHCWRKEIFWQSSRGGSCK